MRYLFEEYALDTDRRELHRGADVVSVAPQVFDLLDYLIRNKVDGPKLAVHRWQILDLFGG